MIVAIYGEISLLNLRLISPNFAHIVHPPFSAEVGGGGGGGGFGGGKV